MLRSCVSTEGVAELMRSVSSSTRLFWRGNAVACGCAGRVDDDDDDVMSTGAVLATGDACSRRISIASSNALNGQKKYAK